MAKTPWQYLGRKSHCWKAHFFKICFFVKYFRQRLLSLVNMGVEVDMTIWWAASVTPPLKNPGYAPESTTKHVFKHFIFRVILFNTFWKFLRLGNSAWDFLGVNFDPGTFLGFIESLSDCLGFWSLPPFEHPRHHGPVTWNPGRIPPREMSSKSNGHLCSHGCSIHGSVGSCYRKIGTSFLLI